MVKVTTSGMASSHSVTGGVYKARERIHRRMADRRLLARSEEHTSELQSLALPSASPSLWLR